MAASFSTAMRVLERGKESSRSRVPRSSSPAIAPAPLPTEATRNSAGIMNENSSLPRYPAAEVKSAWPPNAMNALSASG